MWDILEEEVVVVAGEVEVVEEEEAVDQLGLAASNMSIMMPWIHYSKMM
jgi:hypothetical protein